jgi:hypothetical protein
MNKIKIYFSLIIGIVVLVVFLILRLKPKPSIPFFFDGFWDPFVVILLVILIRKILQIWANRRKKEEFGFFYKFRLFVYYYIISKRDEILFKIEQKIGNRFPIFFFKLTKCCHEFILWNDLLLKNEKFLKRLLGKFLLNFFILPVYFTFFLDIYLHVWHYIYWGMIMSGFCHFIFITLISRLGKYYLVWFYKKFRPNEIEELKDLFK